MHSPNFMFLAKRYFSGNHTRQRITDEGRFKSHYGVSPTTCAQLWIAVLDFIPRGCNPKHLLWTLFKMKTYNTDYVCSSIFKCDRTTFNKWFWIVAKCLSSLQKVGGRTVIHPDPLSDTNLTSQSDNVEF